MLRGFDVQSDRDFGLNPAGISDAAIGEDVLGYVEFHIEQGPVLESVDRPLGVVEAVAGQSRLELTFRAMPIMRDDAHESPL
jgi:allantoate deiminase